MNAIPKLILLTHLLARHKLKRKSTSLSMRWCKEVGIEINQVMGVNKGVSILVDEVQAEAALVRWIEAQKEAEKPQAQPLDLFETGRLDRLENRMISQEHGLDLLVQAQNIVAERIKILLQQLGVSVPENKDKPEAPHAA